MKAIFIVPGSGAAAESASARIDRAKLEPGDVVLYYPSVPGWGHRLIELYQRTRGYRMFDALCVHVAIYSGAGTIIDAMPGYGTCARPLDTSDEGRILRVRRLKFPSTSDRELFLETLNGLVGRDYSFAGILGGATGLRSNLLEMSAAFAKVADKQTTHDSGVDEALSGLYCSQIFDYCYTRVFARSLGDIPVSQLFPPAALSFTGILEDVDCSRKAQVTG